MLVSQEDIIIFNATKAGPDQAKAILAGIATWEKVTPESMYESGKATFDKLGLTRSEMITQLKIELINKAGGGNGVFDMGHSKPIQQAKKIESTNNADENKRSLLKGLGLSQNEVNEILLGA